MSIIILKVVQSFNIVFVNLKLDLVESNFLISNELLYV